MLQFIVTGRLGKDAELRQLQSGKNVLNFSVGTDVGYGQNKKTVWVDCSMFGERGGKIEQYLTKGTAVTVVGDGDLRTWDSNGKSGASLTVNVREVEFQGGGNRDGKQSKPQSQGGWDQPEDLDDNIPF